MPSNNKKKKRNRGKARRKKSNSTVAIATAPKAAKDEDDTFADAAFAETSSHQALLSIGRALMSGHGQGQENCPCPHGLTSLDLSDQPECKTFLTAFFDEIEKRDDGGHVVNATALALQEILPNTLATWFTDEATQKLNAWFVCIGVTCLLQVTTVDNSHDNDPAAAMALATLELEDFCSAFFGTVSGERKRNDDSMTVLTDDGRGKVRDLLCGGERALTKFFRRRITCSCLDTKYLQVKPLPRTGNCSWCKTRMKLKELKICSGCNVCHYCSRECQVKSWPTHKAFCGSYLDDILAKANLALPQASTGVVII